MLGTQGKEMRQSGREEVDGRNYVYCPVKESGLHSLGMVKLQKIWSLHVRENSMVRHAFYLDHYGNGAEQDL